MYVCTYFIFQFSSTHYQYKKKKVMKNRSVVSKIDLIDYIFQGYFSTSHFEQNRRKHLN